MAGIQKIIEKNKNFTSLVFTEKVSHTDIIDGLNDFYSSGTTINLLVDFSNSDITSLTADQLQIILNLAKSHVDLRMGGRTAIVISDEFGFGMGRMYEILSELNNHPIPQRVFKSMDEAINWLESKDANNTTH